VAYWVAQTEKETDGQTEGRMDGSGLLVRRSLPCKKKQMRSVLATRGAVPDQATFFKILAFCIDQFFFGYGL
jgi:hypothetical protein